MNLMPLNRTYLLRSCKSKGDDGYGIFVHVALPMNVFLLPVVASLINSCVPTDVIALLILVLVVVS